MLSNISEDSVERIVQTEKCMFCRETFLLDKMKPVYSKLFCWRVLQLNFSSLTTSILFPDRVFHSAVVLTNQLALVAQGPRSNFEIFWGGGGGGTPLVTQYGGATKHFFVLILNNFQLKILGGTCPPPLLRGPCGKSGDRNLHERTRAIQFLFL